MMRRKRMKLKSKHKQQTKKLKTNFITTWGEIKI